jgi:hypothetical protein
VGRIRVLPKYGRVQHKRGGNHTQHHARFFRIVHRTHKSLLIGILQFSVRSCRFAARKQLVAGLVLAGQSFHLIQQLSVVVQVL